VGKNHQLVVDYGQAAMRLYSDPVRDSSVCGCFYETSSQYVTFEFGVNLARYKCMNIRILLVDDFEDWRNQVRLLLGARPEWQVICEASDGLEAVRRAEALKPDLVLLDIGLPKLNGLEAARQIRKLVPESKILTLSQESDAGVKQELFDLGVSGYVVKARARKELLTAVETVLQGKQFIGSGLQDLDPSLEEAKANISFHFEFDFENRIFQTRFSGRVTDESIRHCYRIFNTLASRVGLDDLRASIADFSGVTSVHLTRAAIRELATSPLADPLAGRPSVIVAPNTQIYGLARMFQRVGKSTRPNVHVVRRAPDAFTLLGVTNPHFRPFEPNGSL
jgi:DNA-binding NarL/FixJ family response regulator